MFIRQIVQQAPLKHCLVLSLAYIWWYRRQQSTGRRWL